MGKITPTAREDASVVATVTGFATTGRAGAAQADGQPFHAGGAFNLTVAVSNDFDGTYALVRSFDGGTTWHRCTAAGKDVTFDDAVTEAIPSAFEASVLYDVEVITLVAGSIDVRLSR
jgi:hypothetical protein